MKYENVRQGPQAEFDAALLELLTVWTSPCIIRGKLEYTCAFRHAFLFPSNKFGITAFPVASITPASAYLFLLSVELKALRKRTGLRLQMLLLYLTHTFSIRNVFILSSFEQTVGVTWHKSQRDQSLGLTEGINTSNICPGLMSVFESLAY